MKTNTYALTRGGKVVGTYATKAEAIRARLTTGGTVCGLNLKGEWVRFKVQSR